MLGAFRAVAQLDARGLGAFAPVPGTTRISGFAGVGIGVWRGCDEDAAGLRAAALRLLGVELLALQAV
jgi:hypothetical protein